ncbi:hypothetical protein GQ42DRAFT_160362 [Ramicandelaber brevisporus]|nr:hypothetical protein GQ42DRAFT_160362 [Ramicandelaber brevisporus]
MRYLSCTTAVLAAVLVIAVASYVEAAPVGSTKPAAAAAPVKTPMGGPKQPGDGPW